MVVAVLTGLGSSLVYSLTSVAEQRLASAAPPEQSLRLGLLAGLLRRPLWLAAQAGDLVAYGMQALALARGALALVEPLLVSSLLFALPAGAALSGRRLGRAEWLGAATVSAGLALFLVAADPGAGRADATAGAWLVAVVAVAAVAGGAVLAAHGPPRPWRAAMLALAGGVTFGLTAALTRASAHLLGHSLGTLLASWQPYALLGTGLVGLLVTQSAFQAGPLAASLPMLIAAEPVTGVIIGVTAFGEPLHLAGVAPLLEAVGLAAVLTGVVVLGRSPVVLSTRTRPTP